MSTAEEKLNIPYEVLTVGEELIGIAITDREGRAPIAKAKISASGVVEFVGSDGVIEVLGGSDASAPENVIRKLRSHPEGLLVVFFATSEQGVEHGPVGEQLVSASFFK